MDRIHHYLIQVVHHLLFHALSTTHVVLSSAYEEENGESVMNRGSIRYVAIPYTE
jgi:hypothetical protein